MRISGVLNDNVVALYQCLIQSVHIYVDKPFKLRKVRTTNDESRICTDTFFYLSHLFFCMCKACVLHCTSWHSFYAGFLNYRVNCVRFSIYSQRLHKAKISVTGQFLANITLEITHFSSTKLCNISRIFLSKQQVG